MNELIQYVRDATGHPFGCVLAIDKDHIGYSLCHEKDQFSKERAKQIARGRAKTGVNWLDVLYNIVQERIARRKCSNVIDIFNPLGSMYDRAERYFKDNING